MKFLNNEAKKIWSIKTLIIVVAVYLVANVVIVLNNPSNTQDNWREKANEEIDILEHLLVIQGNDADLESVDLIGKNIACIEYSLANNIPYGILNVWNHLQGMDGMNTFLFLIVIILCHKIITIEDESKTWKNLFVTGFGNKKVLLFKIIYAILQTIFLSLLYFIISFFVGLIVYGLGSSTSVLNYVNSNFIQQNLLSELFATYSSLILKGLFYSSITLMLTAIMGKNKVSLVLPISMLIGGALINEYIANLKWSKYLPFKYISMDAETIFTNNMLIVLTVILLIYIIGGFAGSILLFKRDES